MKKLDVVQAVLFVAVCALLDWNIGTLAATINGICGGMLLARALMRKDSDDGE